MRIIVTTDGSEQSRSALAHAGRLAAASRSDLLNLRILDKLSDLSSAFEPSVAAATKHVAGEWRAELAEEATALGVDAEPVVVVKKRREDTAQAILSAAAEERATAIAMATRGTGALRHALLGSVAMNVLGHTNLPVILAGAHIGAPAGGEARPYHLVVTTDGSTASAAVWLPLRRLLRKAEAAAVRITILRIDTGEPAAGREGLGTLDSEWQAAQFREEAPVKFAVATHVRPAPGNGRIDEAIVAAAAELGADSIWMASHGHSLRRHLLAGSVALGVVAKAAVPVALVRPE
jgi:nucleotide-binding universal stress UspA family protein